MDENKVEELAKVLKEVLGCSPNLLFHAVQKVGSEALLDGIRQQLVPDTTEKQRKRTARIYMLCLSLSRTLMPTGEVEFNAGDAANLIAYMQLEKSNGNRR